MKDLYDIKYFRASRPFQKDNKRLDKLTEVINGFSPQKVLDVGCGIGSLVKRLKKEGIEAIGIDFSSDLKESFWKGDDSFLEADAKSLPFSDHEFDLVFSSDFFEHVNESEIDQVASEMKRVGKKVMAFVADDIGEKLNKRRLLYHVTNKPLVWWKDKLPGIEVFSSHL